MSKLKNNMSENLLIAHKFVRLKINNSGIKDCETIHHLLEILDMGQSSQTFLFAYISVIMRSTSIVVITTL